jgi:hypothetical protein
MGDVVQRLTIAVEQPIERQSAASASLLMHLSQALVQPRVVLADGDDQRYRVQRVESEDAVARRRLHGARAVRPRSRARRSITSPCTRVTSVSAGSRAHASTRFHAK